jgi:hypothetical protein
MPMSDAPTIADFAAAGVARISHGLILKYSRESTLSENEALRCFVNRGSIETDVSRNFLQIDHRAAPKECKGQSVLPQT